MPREFNHKPQELPPELAEGHLGLLRADGMTIPLPKGTVIQVITDPSAINGVTPWALERVAQNKLWLRCACGTANCDRRAELPFKFTGTHKGKEVIK